MPTLLQSLSMAPRPAPLVTNGVGRKKADLGVHNTPATLPLPEIHASVFFFLSFFQERQEGRGEVSFPSAAAAANGHLYICTGLLWPME